MIDQIGLGALGILAVFFLAQKKSYMRWGYIFGLLSEPFWFYTSLKHEQWGIVVLTFVYAFCYALGIYNYWIKK